MEYPSRGLPSVACLAVAALVPLACGGSGNGGPAGAAEEEGSRDRQISIQAVNKSGMAGSARVSHGGDALTVKVEVLGVKAGESYPVTLNRGGCGSPGEEVAPLDPPTVATVGLGSSLTSLSPGGLEPGASYSINVRMPDGTRAACGSFEAAG